MKNLDFTNLTLEKVASFIQIIDEHIENIGYDEDVYQEMYDLTSFCDNLNDEDFAKAEQLMLDHELFSQVWKRNY